MIRGGILLIIFGIGTFIIQLAGLLSGIGFLAQSQPLVGSLMIVTGLGMLWYDFLDRQKAKAAASSTATYANQPAVTPEPVPAVPTPTVQPTARYSQPPASVTTTAAPVALTGSLSEQDYVNRLAYGIQLAQSGAKVEANRLLGELLAIRPTDTTLLMWLAFTSPDLATSRNFINRIAQLEPANPTLPSARQWLATQENQA